MVEFLSSPHAKFFFVPLITILLGMFIKISSVNDNYRVEKKEWFYLGPDMISTGILLVFVELGYREQQHLNADGILSALALCIVSIIVMPLWIRKFGCVEQPIPQEYKHNLWKGIVIPDVYGVIILYLILKLIGE